MLLIVVVGVSLLWAFTQDLNPTTDDAQVDGHSIVVSPRVAGYVSKMNIDDNTVVSPGDVMIQLDPADYQARVDQARAALGVAEARAASLKITVPFTIGTTTSATAAADAQVAGATADLDRATTTYNRVATSELGFAEANVAARKAEMEKAEMDVKRTDSLAQQSEISRQQYDAYVAAAQVTRNDWLAAQQRLEAVRQDASAAKAAEETASASVLRAKAQLRESRAQEMQSGVRKADYESALADVQQAKAELEQATLNLSYTTLRAPMHGVVTRRTVEPGQQFAIGQAMFQLVPLDNVWVTANFKETQLAHVRPGQHVRISVDAYDGKTFDGVVDSIASSTGSREALLPPENATGNFVKVVQRIPVKILVHQKQGSSEILRPGMNVEAKIRTTKWFF
ncbi:HlyD family secretion protein [Silvibacterium sp.]|uniref:HlyD family secretion protein n=1 Tax=Silvibacterium sp. TaxID=1964179 RepID=UPI0039E6CFDE